MAVTVSFTNQKKKIVLLLDLMFHLQHRKATTDALKIQKTNANGICSENHWIGSSTYQNLLKECIKRAALSEGKLVHAHMTEMGFMSDRLLLNTLLDMYAKCGSLLDARKVFDEMPDPNVFSWTMMIAAYTRHGFAEEALELFRQLRGIGIQSDQYVFTTVLPACAKLVDLEKGMEIHGEVIRNGFQYDVFVGNALIDMYAKCGCTEMAHNVFDKMRQRDVISWNTMIVACAQNGEFDEAFKLFKKMVMSSEKPDSITFVSLLSACVGLAALEQGKEIHEEVIRTGLQCNVVVGSALVDMYAKCGRIDNAHSMFDKIPQRDLVLWNIMIAAYSRNGLCDEALGLFYQMQQTRIQPNQFTFASILPACAKAAALDQGLKIHEEIIRRGFQSDVVVGIALIDMYVKCASLEQARDVFETMHPQDVTSWNAMIAGYTQNGHFNETLKLFQKMQLAGVVPDSITFANLLPACASLTTLQQGMVIHGEIVRGGFQYDVFVGSALVDMYAKCGSIEKACVVFDEMPHRNTVSWTVMIAVYAQNGFDVEALRLFRHMQVTGVKSDSKTFSSVLPACAGIAALEQGMEIHGKIIRTGFQTDVSVGSALVDMYAKCGNIDKARALFDRMTSRNAISWTSMIAAFAMHGFGREALKLFEQMQHSGINPDHVTLLCVLTACCHAGLIDEGQHYFDCMSKSYHVTPTMEHYGCMVDLLARAGRFDEAQDFINRMPMKPTATVWRCLLSACRLHNNLELGELVAEQILELNPENSAPYVLLSNIYAASGRWNDIEKVRKMMQDRCVKKIPGCSWIEVNKQIHAFIVGNRSHLQTQQMCAEWESLPREMKSTGYVPDTIVLSDMEEE